MLTKLLRLHLLRVGHMIFNSRINTVKLLPRDRVDDRLKRLADTLEERVVVGARGRLVAGLFVWVVTEDFAAVGDSDLVFVCGVSEVVQTEDGVVVLFLPDAKHFSQSR